jgi:hypothetical protein
MSLKIYVIYSSMNIFIVKTLLNKYFAVSLSILNTHTSFSFSFPGSTMARLQGDEKKYLQVSPKIIARLIVSLIFMSCCLNILYLTQLQESEDAMEVVSGVRQLQKATAKSTAAKDPPEPSNASSSQVPDISTRGKERILKLLRDAGITDLDNTTVAALPTWNEISQLYGSQSSIVYGLDTCAHYREMIPASERRTAVAGLFNTGTNAIAWSLSHNIKSSRTNYWQVRSQTAMTCRDLF